MASLRERVVLPEVVLVIELNANGQYRLNYGDRVLYQNGEKWVRGRQSPYRFRSVEQLRYDFERDVEAA
jgi:hypothetical protein